MVMELKRRSSTRSHLWQAVRAGALFALASLALLLFAVSCANLRTPTATTEPVDPREELQRTVSRLTELKSVSFDLGHIVGSTNLLPGVIMHRAYGNAVVPGQFDITVEGELLFPRSYLEIEMISIDDEAYMTNLLNGEWEEIAPSALPIKLGDFGVTLADIVDRVQSPELLGEDRDGGVNVMHIGGAIVSEDLRELVPTAGTGFPVTLEMWIDRDTSMLREALITGQVVVTDVAEAQRRLVLEDPDEAVSIERPDL